MLQITCKSIQPIDVLSHNGCVATQQATNLSIWSCAKKKFSHLVFNKGKQLLKMTKRSIFYLQVGNIKDTKQVFWAFKYQNPGKQVVGIKNN